MVKYFFFNDTATTEIYTLSLHDALPILRCRQLPHRAVTRRLQTIARTRRVERGAVERPELDRKSTRLNSSHVRISYAVFCLKKKNKPGRHGDLGNQYNHICVATAELLHR